MNRTTKLILAGGALFALLFGGGILYWLSARLFFALVSAIGILLMLLSAVTVLLTFRKAKLVAPRSLVISMLISVLSASVIAAFSAFHPGWLLPASGLVFGAMLGSGWASTTVLFREGSAVKSRGTGWYLVVWILTLVLTQLIPLCTGRTPAVAAVLLFGGTGLALGNSGVLLVRCLVLRASAGNSSPPPLPQ